MRVAVTNNRANFVRLLLEHGVSLHSVFTDAEVLDLYADVRFTCILYALVE